MDYLINIFVGFIGVFLGAFSYYWFDKIKRKEIYREFMFKKRVEVYSEILETLNDIEDDLVNEYSGRSELFLAYCEKVIVTKSIFISAEVSVLLSSLADCMDNFKSCEIIYSELWAQILDETASCKILDNADFKKIVKGERFDDLRAKASSKLRGSFDSNLKINYEERK